MRQGWLPLETSTHQDHVVAHVLGATVLGHFVQDETALLLLDIGFVWRIYLDGEMGLLPGTMAISELDAEGETKGELMEDAGRLRAGGGSETLSLMTAAPDGCLIAEVNLYEQDERRRIVVRGEESSLLIETSLATGQITVSAGGGD
ncbi:MAG TPA: hypothetical protein VF507_08400 [Pyrinomonadaceae bacterium]|jgi:hypothetical protein